ncbi:MULTISPECIES: hypothetical protein [Bacteroidaceae]|uniref:Uncharacterized protein n=2 Tax=Bacteroides TaxID=816 RepID=A0A5M5EC50_BACOV|nr:MULTISPECIES: hypothetical protein [Bacteroidaceae]KAA4004484.1 hypothetical protein F3D64_23165 [Bacteroides ovatus]KAA4007838.1 hypothetical protein F3F37_14160 [Bacteroides ovatus]KAA4016086.1 hypothetical protein F3D53_23185 [Bacteroides ovatus]KAA4023830.1 hypothetical protein F3D52_27720 [Bacteroides ovatus]KAA4030043.1 hypothetical protein F3D60_14195 [Bacteroides ovatus]
MSYEQSIFSKPSLFTRGTPTTFTTSFNGGSGQPFDVHSHISIGIMASSQSYSVSCYQSSL